MIKKKATILILFLSLLVLMVMPYFVSAQRELELDYPEIGGETIAVTTTIPAFVRYIFNLALIIGVIVVIGVLIYGGFSYLTSAGNPTQLKEARAWIFNGLLGLIILFGSWLILYTVNPQLTVLTLERLPLNWGIVVLNQTADNEVVDAGKVDMAKLSTQIELGNAKQVNTIDDFEKIFGPYSATTKRFANFHPISLYILPDAAGFSQDIVVILFSRKNFLGEEAIYTSSAVMEVPGEPGRIRERDCDVNLCQIPSDLFDPNLPPFSLATKYLGTGVYLVAQSNIYQFFTRSSIPDFRRIRYNGAIVNDNVYFLGIRNKPRTDYLAILHEKVNYKGQARIFFEKKERLLKIRGGPPEWGWVGNIDPIAVTGSERGATTTVTGECSGLLQAKGRCLGVESTAGFAANDWILAEFWGDREYTVSIDRIEGDNKIWSRQVIDAPIFSGGTITNYGQPSQATSVDNRVDAYGAIGHDLPSSVQVLQLAETWAGSVTVCPAPDYASTGGISCQTYFEPVWIPQSIKRKPDGSAGDTDLEDKVRSISIDGNFAVVLFENEPEGPPKYWGTGGPEKTQVFTSSMPDLSAEPIGSCNAHSWIPIIGWFWFWEPCTSGIAIYPIK